MKKPTISIIIPTYNRAAIINKTIDSFIAQDFNDWEMIVVDDHSKDNTKEVIEKYHKRDARIGYMLNERKKGAQGARNTGILHAQADWVVLFDSDDYVYPNFLSTLKAAVDDKTDVVTCYAQIMMQDGSEARVLEWGGEGNIEYGLLTGANYVNFDDCLFRKSKLFEIGLLDEDCPRYQEFDTHIRLSRAANYKWVKDVLMDYMWGGDDALSKGGTKNIDGRAYVVWHNQDRWREVAYDAYFNELKNLFRRVSRPVRRMLIKMEPKVLLALPQIYFEAAVRVIKRKLK